MSAEVARALQVSLDDQNWYESKARAFCEGFHP